MFIIFARGKSIFSLMFAGLRGTARKNFPGRGAWAQGGMSGGGWRPWFYEAPGLDIDHRRLAVFAGGDFADDEGMLVEALEPQQDIRQLVFVHHQDQADAIVEGA